MERLRYPWLLALTLVVLTLAVPLTVAQDDPTTLTLTSADVLFQPLAPGEVPLFTDFTRELTITTDTREPIIYVALTNTGWSSGTLMLVSDALDPDAPYVALEVDADGVPVEGGLAFDLIPDDDLGGFMLPVLIAQTRTFGVFRVVDDAGIAFTGQTTAREDDLVTQSEIEIMIDPLPVFAPLVLECHIAARPIPVEEPESDAETPGTRTRVVAATRAVMRANACCHRQASACGTLGRVALPLAMWRNRSQHLSLTMVMGRATIDDSAS